MLGVAFSNEEDHRARLGFPSMLCECVQQGTDAGLTLELRVTCQGLQRDPEGGNGGITLVCFEGENATGEKKRLIWGQAPFSSNEASTPGE